MNSRRLLVPFSAALLLVPALAHAGEDAISAGDTAWMLMSTALVMLMIPGLAFFYGGMTRRKNVLSTLMHSIVALGAISIVWMVIGYSLAFGANEKGLNWFVGGLDYLCQRGVGMEASGTIPHALFMVFQLTFAAITPALISGSIAERVKFSSYVVFIVLWSVLVYAPVCHWVWGGGWLMERGALDFAGGTVVHILSGAAGAAFAIALGARRGYRKEPMPPHNLPFTILGMGLLWFGWFGFNAGSALAANGLAAIAMVNTNAAAAAAMLSWLFMEKITHTGKPTALGAASGAVAGLVAVTPAAGFVSPMYAVIIGLIGGVCCQIAVSVRAKSSLDDSLDVIGVHFVGGTVGALLTGVFAVEAIGGASGLLEGNGAQLVEQFIGVVASAVYSFVVSLVLIKVIGAAMGLRVSEEEETQGLDISQHGETAYDL